MQVFGGFGLRAMWEVVKAWVTGRHEVARERVDCATGQVVLCDLPPGGIWMDRDGDRLRLIIKPTSDEATCLPQLQHAAGLLEPRPVSPDPRLEQGDGPSDAE